MRKMILSTLGLLLGVQIQAQQKTKVSSNQVTVSIENKQSSQIIILNESTEKNQSEDPTKSKTFSKTYPLNRADEVVVNNKFGSITVVVWNKNEVKVDADIKAYAESDAEAQQLIDQTNIQASKTGSTASFVTSINSSDGNWGRGKKWRREVKVYLTIYMPASNALKASQQYGNLTVPDFAGPTNLNVQYGNVKTGDLKNSENDISVQYGNTDLKNVNEANIKHQYGSGITIASINNLNLKAQYCAVNIGSIKKSANIKQQYGAGISIDEANNMDANIQYASLNIGKQTGNFTLQIAYGKVKIEQLMDSSKAFNADLKYTPISLKFDGAYGGNFKINTSYGSFKYADNIKAKKIGDDDDKTWSSDKAYEGSINKGGSNGVSIRSTYSSVSFQ